MKKFRVSLICLVVSLLVLPCAALAELKVSFFDAGAGAAVLVQADGQTALIDALGQPDAQALFNTLDGLGITKVELLAETLPFTGQQEEAEAAFGTFQTSALWLPVAQVTEQTAGGFAGASVPASEQSFALGGAKITALPVSDLTGEPALALRIEYGQRFFLVLPPAQIAAGSLTGEAETKKADVVRVKDGADLALAEAASALWAVAGELPAQAEGAEDAASGPLVLRPSLDGVITFITDGTAIREEHAAGAVTIKGSVNVRREAKTTAKRVTTLLKGTLVTVTGSVAGGEGVWYAVDIQGKPGYIRADLVRELTGEELEGLQTKAAQKPAKQNGNSSGKKGSGGEEAPPAECH